MWFCDHEIEMRKLDIVLIKKESKWCYIKDIGELADNMVSDKEEGNTDRQVSYGSSEVALADGDCSYNIDARSSGNCE